MRRRAFLTVALAFFLIAVACGSPGEEQVTTTGSGQGAGMPIGSGRGAGQLGHGRGGTGPEAPPPVTIHYGDGSMELEPWSFCYKNGCADGAPPERPHDVGSPDEIFVRYPLQDWKFSATFSAAGEKCPRMHSVDLERTDEGQVLRPAGHADTYDVFLWGRGGGDLAVSFRWTTPHDGPLPEPSARLALISDHDGEYDSYGTELMLTNLRETPHQAKAVITTTAENGKSYTLRAKRARRCLAEGTVYWDRPDTRAPALLGEAPFTYDVLVELDGKRYEARAVWPDDEIRGNEPSVRLDFEPPLPALE